MAAVSCREEVPLPCRLSEGGILKGHVLARWPRPIGPTGFNLVSATQRNPNSINCGGEFSQQGGAGGDGGAVEGGGEAQGGAGGS